MRSSNRASITGSAPIQPAEARCPRGTSTSSMRGGQNLERVADDAEIGETEDRRLGVLVDRDDPLRALHADLVLRRPADADRDVDVGLDGLPGLADLHRVGHPAGVDDGASRADGRIADRRRELVQQARCCRGPGGPARRRPRPCLLELGARRRLFVALDATRGSQFVGDLGLDGDDARRSPPGFRGERLRTHEHELGIRPLQLDVDDLRAAEDLRLRLVGPSTSIALAMSVERASLEGGPRRRASRRWGRTGSARERARAQACAGRAPPAEPGGRRRPIVTGVHRLRPMIAECGRRGRRAGPQRHRLDDIAELSRLRQELERGRRRPSGRPRRRPTPSMPQITFASARRSAIRDAAPSPWTTSPAPFLGGRFNGATVWVGCRSPAGDRGRRAGTFRPASASRP